MSRRLFSLRAIAAFLSVVAFTSIALAGGAQTQPVQAEMAPQGSVRNDVAAPASDKTLYLVFAMNGVKTKELAAYAESVMDPDSPNFRKFLTPQQVGERYGAPTSQISAVVGYAKSLGMNVSEVLPNRFFVSASTTVATAEKAFGVKLVGYNRPPVLTTKSSGPTMFAPDRAPQLPSSVASVVTAVYGLSDGLVMRHDQSGGMAPVTTGPTNPVPPGGSSALANPMTPADIEKFYNVTPIHASGNRGNKRWIAIYSPTGHDWSDIFFFCNTYGVYPSWWYIAVDGGNSDLTNQAEACLDGEVIAGQASNANIIYFQCPNTGSSDLNTYNVIANNPQYAEVCSSSWTWDETNLKNNFPSYLSSVEAVMSQMAAQGIAHYVASGDNGAYNDGSHLTVGYPTSSQFVTGVGGTDNLVDSGGYWAGEVGWGGSGGGYSAVFARPSWQWGNGVDTGTNLRQVPDVSAAGGPNPGYNIRVAGNWYQVWGTSASTPLWASIHLLLDNENPFGAPLGNLNNLIYRRWRAIPYFVHDITTGNNGFYSNTYAYDLVTGIGSLNAGQLWYDMYSRPDLTYYKPSGWSSSLVLTTTSSSRLNQTYYHELRTYYIAYCLADLGNADSVSPTVTFYDNGSPWAVGDGNSSVNFPAVPAHSYMYYVSNLFPRTWTAGSHTLAAFVDSPNSILETNEGNNVNSKTFTVLPALTYVNPKVTVQGGNGAWVLTKWSSGVPASPYTYVTSTNTAVIPGGTYSPAVGTTATNLIVNTNAVRVTTTVKIYVKYGAMVKSSYITVTP